VINCVRGKHFGLIDVSQKGLEGNTTLGRGGESREHCQPSMGLISVGLVCAEKDIIIIIISVIGLAVNSAH
jgi:hypothetical protein